MPERRKGARSARGMLMRRLLTALTALYVALVLPLASAQAGSPPVTITEQFADTLTFNGVVPCQENVGALDITLTFRGVSHVTAAGINGDSIIPPYQVTETLTGTVAGVPSDGTGPTFSGHFTQRLGENSNNANATSTFTFAVVGAASTGERSSFHIVEHLRVNANGVEVSFGMAHC